MRATLERLVRRVQHMVAIGRLTAPIDDSGNIQSAQITIQPDGVPRDGTKIMGVAGLSSNPPVGTDMVVLFLNGDRSKGLVVATGNQEHRAKGLKTGETVLHNFTGISILLGVDGVTINAGGQKVTVTNGSLAHFDMPIESTGEITANCTGAAVKLSQHTHTDSRGGTTSLPQG